MLLVKILIVIAKHKNRSRLRSNGCTLRVDSTFDKYLKSKHLVTRFVFAKNFGIIFTPLIRAFSLGHNLVTKFLLLRYLSKVESPQSVNILKRMREGFSCFTMRINISVRISESMNSILRRIYLKVQRRIRYYLCEIGSLLGALKVIWYENCLSSLFVIYQKWQSPLISKTICV